MAIAFSNNIDEMKKRHQIQRETNNYVQAIHHSSWQKQQAARDRSHHKPVQTIRGEATFYDPHR